MISSLSPFAPENLGLARQVRRSRPASARPFSTPRLNHNLVRAHRRSHDKTKVAREPILHRYSANLWRHISAKFNCLLLVLSRTHTDTEHTYQALLVGDHEASFPLEGSDEVALAMEKLCKRLQHPDARLHLSHNGRDGRTVVFRDLGSL